MQRSLLIGLVAAALAAGAIPATAADIRPLPPVAKAPAAVVAPAYSWTGCHIGAHGGYGWGNKAFRYETDTVDSVEHKVDGWLAGGQVGCDWQSNQFVFGIEGQMAWANLKGSSPDPESPASWHSQVSALGMVVGRLGLAVNRTLFYANGGVAFAKERHWVNDPDDITEIPILAYDTGKIWRVGWTVGAGIEHAFADNWSAKIEYSYMDFGRKDIPFEFLLCDPGPCQSLTYSVRQQVHAIKLGVNYRFNFHRPVVARY